MLLHTEHSRRLALTSLIAVARAAASSSLERRIWNASRCADLLPTPGSFLSSSIRRAIGSAKRDIESGDLEIGSSGENFRWPDHQMARSPESWQPSQHAAHGGLHAIVYFLRRAVEGGGDQVLQHFNVAVLDRLRIDLDAQYLLAAVHFNRHRAPARRTFDNGLLHLFLQQFVLLLGLRHQLLNIESAHRTSVASG